MRQIHTKSNLSLSLPGRKEPRKEITDGKVITDGKAI